MDDYKVLLQEHKKLLRKHDEISRDYDRLLKEQEDRIDDAFAREEYERDVHIDKMLERINPEWKDIDNNRIDLVSGCYAMQAMINAGFKRDQIKQVIHHLDTISKGALDNNMVHRYFENLIIEEYGGWSEKACYGFVFAAMANLDIEERKIFVVKNEMKKRFEKYTVDQAIIGYSFGLLNVNRENADENELETEVSENVDETISAFYERFSNACYGYGVSAMITSGFSEEMVKQIKHELSVLLKSKRILQAEDWYSRSCYQ